MNLQKFVKILNKEPRSMQDLEKVGDFFKQHGPNIFANENLLLVLLEQRWHKQKINQLYRLEWVIAFRNEIYETDHKNIVILPVYRYFADYINCCCAFFGNKRIPFEEWEDLAKEQVDILKILVEKNQLKSFRKTKLFRDFCDKFDKRELELFKKGYHQLWDNEYQ